MIIDAHVHVWIDDARFPWAPETSNPPEEDASVEMLLENMDRTRVDKTVLIQVIHYRWDNSYAADCLKRFPDRFEGVCRVNPLAPDAAEDLSFYTLEQGFRGVRLSPSIESEGDWIGDGTTDAIWARARELGVPMTVLTGCARLPDIQEMAEKFPGLQIVIDHSAWPRLDEPELFENLLALQSSPDIFIKISGMWVVSSEEFPFPDAQESWRRIYDCFGPERLIWGTDWPVSQSRLTYQQAHDLMAHELDFLTREDKEWIFGKTALRVWPFDQQP